MLLSLSLHKVRVHSVIYLFLLCSLSSTLARSWPFSTPVTMSAMVVKSRKATHYHLIPHPNLVKGLVVRLWPRDRSSNIHTPLNQPVNDTHISIRMNTVKETDASGYDVEVSSLCENAMYQNINVNIRRATKRTHSRRIG